MESDLVYKLDRLQSDPKTAISCHLHEAHGRFGVDVSGRYLVCGQCIPANSKHPIELDAYGPQP